jgi:hypothetical protein
MLDLYVGYVCLLCGCLCFHWFLVRLGSYRLWVAVFLRLGRMLSDSNAILIN